LAVKENPNNRRSRPEVGLSEASRASAIGFLAKSGRRLPTGKMPEEVLV
jgi:hypothetical protein